MMEKLNINRPLRAKAIYLKGNSKPLRDRVIYIAGNFLVVAEHEDDNSPDWYNMDKVDHLEGVEKLPQVSKAWVTVF